MNTVPVTVVGVYPVKAKEPVWLVEVELKADFDSIDWGSITQPEPGRDQSYWQVPYDEQPVGSTEPGEARAVFFFHYLRLNEPLRSAYGDLPIPPASLLPPRLEQIP
jgi:hypothetical protein